MDAREALNADPLQRLEAELEATGEPPSATDQEQPDGAQLYEEAQRLLEEAWSIFTECQVMRDGLLAACDEIDRAMDGIQEQLGGSALATEPNGNGHANGNGNGNGRVENGNGHSNGNGHPENGNGHANGNGRLTGGKPAATGSSNGSGPH
jgi:hypothetical protein